MLHVRRHICVFCLTVLLALSAFVSSAIFPTGTPFQTQTAHAQPTPDGSTLLLVHGYWDTCDDAFNQINTNVNGDGPNAIPTYQFLTSHGWNANKVIRVGYYNYDFGCDTNMQDSQYQSQCNDIYSSSSSGVATNDDPIQHLGCLMAWYIYDTFTTNNQQVTILAHSMGGLIVRAAIGGSGHGVKDFPAKPLDVSRVVTVGTPHGGLARDYGIVESSYSNTQEVRDMLSTSPFMQTLQGPLYQDPQGIKGTYWALMASSVACNGVGLSCAARIADARAGITSSDPYPWGDMIVQATSALDMKAQLKILYGYVHNFVTGFDKIADADPTNFTQYQHAVNSCGPLSICLLPPFYLTDGTVDNSSDAQANTQAWVCWKNCTNQNDTSFGDIDLTQTYTVLHSLAQINSLLSLPPVFSNAATNIDGREEVFYRVSNNDIWHNWWTGSQWSGQGQLQSSGDPGSFNGNPVAGENADGMLEVFAVASDNFIWHIWQNTDGSWSSWSRLPTTTTFTGTPAVARNQDGRLELFARSLSGGIWHIAQVGPNGTGGGWGANWSQMQSGPTFNSDPVVATNSDGRLEVFARQSNNNIGHIWQDPNGNNGWDASGWVSVTNGYTFTNTPAVARNTDGRLELFSRGSDGNIWHIWQLPTGGWNGTWGALQAGKTFPADASPGVAQNNTGQLEVFIRGSNNNVYHMWQNSPSTGWNSSGWSPIAANISPNYFIGTPVIAHNSSGQFEVFMQDNTRVSLWHNWHDYNSNTWNSSWGQLS